MAVLVGYLKNRYALPHSLVLIIKTSNHMFINYNYDRNLHFTKNLIINLILNSNLKQGVCGQVYQQKNLLDDQQFLSLRHFHLQPAALQMH